MELDRLQVEVEKTVIENDLRINIKPNLSYVKERNVAERIIKELRKFGFYKSTEKTLNNILKRLNKV